MLRQKAVALLDRMPAVKHAVVTIKTKLDQVDYERRFGKMNEIDKRLVLFSAYSGKQFACSPKELYLEMRRDPKYSGYHFVWAFSEPEKFAELADDGRTSLVVYGSEEHKKILSQAKYWISNTREPSGIVKKPGQIYIQTWHGTPLKKLGFDVEHYISGADDIYSVRRTYELDAKRFDYLLSPSPFYSEHMASAFHLKAIGKEDVILEEGYPRNDPLYLATQDDTERIRRKIGIPEGKKVILYAPTWREENLNPALGFTYRNGINFTSAIDFHRLKEELGEDYVILLRTHYFVSRKIDFSQYDGALINVSDYPDVNDLYIAADLLMTDYSSVFFDFSILKKPMVFYMYDLENYRNVRDFYFDLDILPGPIVEKEEALAETIKNQMEQFEVNEKYRSFLEMFSPIPGPCASRILDRIIPD